MQCPKCLEQMPDDDVFCEACGSSLSDKAPLSGPVRPQSSGCACGATAEEIGEDGYCERCGKRAFSSAADRIELALSTSCAAVCDRGLKHLRNEDRFGIRQTKDGYALVVCDGVSGSRDSEVASALVAECVVEALADGRDVLDAICSAETRLTEKLAAYARENTPSTTVVAAKVEAGKVSIGWVGDSRAYWIGPAGARQLTVDHSWINSVVAAGEMSREEAQKAPQAHGITRWLGADAGENASAETTQFEISESGIFLLCSDGFWNYAESPEQIVAAVRSAAEDAPDALAIAKNLVEFAIARGGHDNVTAVVVRRAESDESKESHGQWV